MTGSDWLRVALLLLVAGAGWRCIYLLLADWARITPPYWRWILGAFHVVLGANAGAIGVALTMSTDVTLATWGLLGSYALLTSVALVAPHRHR